MISELISRHLRFLVDKAGFRPPGSPANRLATEHARAVLRDSCLTASEAPFHTRWWEPGDGRLEIRDDMSISETVRVQPNPYSPACDLTGTLRRAAGLEEITGRVTPSDILVLEGDLVSEQIVPPHYPFYGIDDHKALVKALLDARPAAVIAVSDHWAPVFEDADLPLPSTTVPTALAPCLPEGAEAHMVLGGVVHEADGVNLSARHGPPGDRIVLSAHLDSKVTTPGAFDNAGSAAVLLALAESGLLADLPGDLAVELVLFNGEDHFDACGEVAWLARTDLGEVVADINIDGAGVVGRPTQVSLLSCPDHVERAVRAFTTSRHGWVMGEPWYESDHSIFAMRGIPAVAITSSRVHDLLGTIAHTERDTLEVVDVAVLADLATNLPELLTDLWGALHEAPVS